MSAEPGVVQLEIWLPKTDAHGDWPNGSRNGRTLQTHANKQLTAQNACEAATANSGWPRGNSPGIAGRREPPMRRSDVMCFRSREG